jgi:hypothetical protein
MDQPGIVGHETKRVTGGCLLARPCRVLQSFRRTLRWGNGAVQHECRWRDADGRSGCKHVGERHDHGTGQHYTSPDERIHGSRRLIRDGNSADGTLPEHWPGSDADRAHGHAPYECHHSTHCFSPCNLQHDGGGWRRWHGRHRAQHY